jgi:signal transduction histidine kinase
VEDIIRHSAEHGEYGPGEVETIVNDLLTQYREREPAIYERRLEDGTVLEVRTSPMPSGGVAVSLMDVTDRVLASRELEEAKRDLEARVDERTRDLMGLNEQLRRASNAAQQANLGKTRFLAAASHDLLQPLNAARLFLSSLSERELDQDSGEIVGRVDTSLRAVEDLLAGLLDISKLDAGGVEPQMEDFRVDDLLQALGTEFAAVAGDREDRSPTSLRAQFDHMPEHAGNPLDNGQPQAEPLLLGFAVGQALKLPENGFAHILGNSGTGVPDLDLQIVAPAAAADQDPASGRGIA